MFACLQVYGFTGLHANMLFTEDLLLAGSKESG
jgi:hypothetical protein